MAQFGWAYINCADTGSDGSGSGPQYSLQFVTESAGGTTGSAYLTYYTASYSNYDPSTLVLSGNLWITGGISASYYHIENIAIIDATGSTYFGDDQTDIHARTGSLEMYSDSALVFKVAAASSKIVAKGGISGSSTLEIVGATTLGSTLGVSGSVTLGDAAADVTTVTAQLSASQGGYFADRVGIGTATPDGNLHVLAASAGSVTVGGQQANGIIVEDDDSTAITLLDPNGGVIYFGDADDTDIGRIGYRHGGDYANSLYFTTNNAQRMTIDSSGKLGIGDPSPTHKLTVAGAISGSSTLEAVGATTLGSTLNVSGTTTLAGTTNAQAVTYTTISGSSTLQTVGATTLGSTLNVSGAITGADNIGTTGGFLTASAQLKGLSLVLEGQTAIDKNRNATLNAFSGSGTLQVVGATVLGSTLNVSGAITGADNIGTTGGFLTASAQLKGLSLVLEGQTAIDKNRNATFAAVSGSGTLQAVGATILGGALNVTGAVTLAGPASGSAAGDGSFLAVNSAGLLVLDTPAGGAGSSTDIFTTVDASSAYTTSSINVGSSDTPANPLAVIGISELSGGVIHKRVHKTAHYTVTTADYYVGVDSSGGAVTLTLPAAAAALDGQTWIIKDEGGSANSNNITVTGSGVDAETIEGTNKVVLESAYGALSLYCDGGTKFFVY